METYDGLASAFSCRAFRMWLGDRFEIHRRFHASGSDHFDRHFRDRQRRAVGIAVKTLPIGTAYAIWTGIGSVGTVLLGIWLLGDAATARRLLCISMIVAGIAGLKATA